MAALPAKNAGQSRKKKHPPTFQHLPRDRAIKLKKEWIEKEKLKSKWRAQKRKEGLNVGARASWDRQLQGGLADATEAAEDREDEGEEDHEESVNELSVTNEEEEHEHREPPQKRVRINAPEPAVNDRRQQTSRKTKEPSTPLPSSETRIDTKGKTRARVSEGPEDGQGIESAKPSLRELTRQAYSRASLHTFRADPLHRRKDAVSNSDSRRGANRARGTRGGYRGGGGPLRSDRGGRGRGRSVLREGTEGRGQPNMKLRMEAMLERIKQDCT